MKEQFTFYGSHLLLESLKIASLVGTFCGYFNNCINLYLNYSFTVTPFLVHFNNLYGNVNSRIKEPSL